MARTPTSLILRHLRKLAAEDELIRLPDGELLQRFAARRDEAAFEAILQRHGGLVWSVCRRVLPGRHDAEDAFQSTFLTLAGTAASISKPHALACWLYGVAQRTALRLKSRAGRRPERAAELRASPLDPPR